MTGLPCTPAACGGQRAAVAVVGAGADQHQSGLGGGARGRQAATVDRLGRVMGADRAVAAGSGTSQAREQRLNCHSSFGSGWWWPLRPYIPPQCLSYHRRPFSLISCVEYIQYDGQWHHGN